MTLRARAGLRRRQLRRSRLIAGERYVVVDGHLPGAGALRRAVGAGQGVLVVDLPPPEQSLEFLEPVIGSLRRLIVASRAPAVDVAVLEGALSLEELDVWCTPRAAPDLTAVPLRSFAGHAHGAWRAVTGRPELRRLFIEGGDFSWLDASSTLEEVSLTALRGTPEVPNRVQHLTSLRRMSLHGGKRLDIANLAGHPSLETLGVESTGLLAGATALAGLPRLGALHLEDVGQVEDLSWVKPGVSIPQVTIVGTAPWIAEARARSIPTPRGWSFPPWTRR